MAIPVAPPPEVVLPPHLPAQCFVTSAADYGVPAIVLVAMVKTESEGRSVIRTNSNGSEDYGVAQHNSRSWVPYFEQKYGLSRQALLASPCQSIRAQAYVLRREMNAKACGGVDVWCAVGRYHAPYSPELAAGYVERVRASLDKILKKGGF